MDKICIVSLRKKMVDQSRLGNESGFDHKGKEHGLPAGQSSPPSVRIAPGDETAGIAAAGGHGEAATVSLTLTPEQTRALREDARLKPLFKGQSAAPPRETASGDQAIVIKLEFEPQRFVRLLKPEEVMEMLRISRSYLNEVVRKGILKSYKMGKLRRFMLDDVLSYLEGSLDCHQLQAVPVISAGRKEV